MMQMLFADGSPLPTLVAAGCEATRSASEDPRGREAREIASVPLWGPRLAQSDAVPSSAPGRTNGGTKIQIVYGFLQRRCRVAGPLRNGSTEQTAESAPRRCGTGARIPGSSPDPLPVSRGTGSES